MIKGMKIEIEPKVEQMQCGTCGKTKPWRDFVKLVDDGFFMRFRFYVRNPEALANGDLTDARGFVVCKACDQKGE